MVEPILQIATKKTVSSEEYQEDETVQGSAELTNLVIYAQSWNLLEIDGGVAALRWTN